MRRSRAIEAIAALSITAMTLMPLSCKPVQNVPLIPLEVLFGNPVKSSPLLSPDGRLVSYLAPVNGVLNVWIKTRGRADDRPVTRDTDRGIRGYFWAQDSRRILYIQDAGGNENWRIYSTDLSSGQTRDLTPYEGVQARLMGVHKDHPDHILIELNKDNVSLHDVYRLNLDDGSLELAAKNPGNVSGWIQDAHFSVLGAMVSRADGGTDFLIRSTESSPWKKLFEWSFEDSSVSAPLSFTLDGRSLLLKDSRDADKARLVRMDLSTLDREIVAEDPEVDLGGLMLHPDTYEIQVISFVKDRIENRIVDPAIREDIERIAKYHRGDYFISSRDNADKTWLVGYSVDDGPVDYAIYDRTKRSFEPLFTDRPALNQYTLAKMEPFSFVSRDGLTIHGYLTFPPGKERRDLPMVLNVHGGPWARDGWGYDPRGQWLANRGYLCMQVNYRASTGYGKNFVNAGNKEWGRNCQNDLTDAVAWAVRAGYSDPKRIGIFGGSYGGYAALAGATFTPDLYRCAVAIVGPSNLFTFLRSIPPYWAVYLEEFRKRVGDPDKDEALLRERSPLFHVDRIRIPMMIAQGANDPRVKKEESEQIVEAMKAKNIPHEYLLFPDEGHGFAKPENRLKFYRAAERFLAEHLGGRTET